MSEHNSRDRFEAHLVEFIDRTAAPELLNLVLNDDTLRDERHAAEEVARLVADAGSDFASEPVARSTPAVEANASTAVPEQSGKRSETNEPSSPNPAPEKPGQMTVVPIVENRRLLLAAWITLGLAAAVVAVILIWHAAGKRPPHASNSASNLRGTITGVDAPSNLGRVEICEGVKGACRSARVGDAVDRGMVLRTNARARAKLRFDSGKSIALERATTVTLTETGEVGLTLNGGTIVVDVANKSREPLSIGFALGRVDLEGAKCAISSSPDEATIGVTRGRAQLVDEDGHETSVYAGESARVSSGREIQVTYDRSLGNVMAPSELEADQLDETDRTRGLGELRAMKPGEKSERKNAVRLTRHHVKVRIVGAVAKTEIDETFTNSTNDVLEGIFRFPLPADAQIERLALEVEGKLVEGAFTDRERASAIWRGSIVQAAPQLRAQIRDEIIWVPGPWRDPALLEWQRGNRFELRIYPIPKQGSRRVVLSYTQVVPGAAGLRRYSYPLPQQSSESPVVEDFSLELELRGHDPRHAPTVVGYAGKLSNPSREVARLVLADRRFQPQGDLLIDYELPNADKGLIAWAYQPSSENERPYAAMLLRPKLPRTVEQSPKTYAFVVDTSRSMYGESLRRASELTTRMIRELAPEDRVTLLGCDSECRGWPDGLVDGGENSAERAERWLRSQAAEGASDLTGAVDSALRAIDGSPGESKHIMYVGDGTPSVGPTKPATITHEVQRILARTGVSITAVAIGTDADLESLRALARGGRGVVVPYVPGTNVVRAGYAALVATYGARLTDTQIELPAGFSATAPEHFDTIAAGDELLVVGRLREQQVRGEIVLRGRVKDQPFEQHYDVELRAVTGDSNAFVPRLYAASRIAELERHGADGAKAEAMELSRRFSVASRYTSLLVLESPAMFDAFGLDNRRQTEVWTGELEDSATSANAAEEESAEVATSADRGSVDGGGPAGRLRLSASGSGAAPSAAAAAGPMRIASKEKPEPKKAETPLSSETSKSEARIDTSRGAARSSNSQPLSVWDEDREFERRPPPRTMIPMRRIWERKGEVLPGRTLAGAAMDRKVIAAEKELAADPDRRESTKKLFDLYSKNGDLSRAADLAERWSQRDPLDVEALIARADVAARHGERASAIRILGSVVDIRPSDTGAQQRLSRLYRWQGQNGRACRFSLSLAEFRPTDANALAAALRCLTSEGQNELARELQSAATEPTLRTAERLNSKSPPADGLSGDLRVTATWSGGSDVDLDLSLIDPDAHRVSWLGAPTRAIISATTVTSPREEGLALRGGKPGEYLLELSRGRGSGRVQGTVTVHVAGVERSIPFSFDGERSTLGVIKIRSISRLVPANRPVEWLR